MELKIKQIEIIKTDKIYKLKSLKREKIIKEEFKKNNIILYKTSVRCRLLKKYKIKKETGIPDFCYEKNKDIFFIECKGIDEGIRHSQIEWIINNPHHVEIIVLKLIIKTRIFYNTKTYEDIIRVC